MTTGRSTDGIGISGRDLLRAHGAWLADEVFRAVRHGVLNRLTGLGAVGFQLRQRLGQQVQASGEENGEGVGAGAATAELFASFSRQIGLASEALNRNLLPAPIRPPPPCDLPAP